MITYCLTEMRSKSERALTLTDALDGMYSWEKIKCTTERNEMIFMNSVPFEQKSHRRAWESKRMKKSSQPEYLTSILSCVFKKKNTCRLLDTVL